MSLLPTQLDWSDVELKAITAACCVQSSTVAAGCSRQVAAACMSAAINSIMAKVGKKLGDDSSKAEEALSTHEDIVRAVEEVWGPGLGIGDICRRLRAGGYGDLASTVSNIHRHRKVAAHPLLPARLRSALEQIHDEEITIETESVDVLSFKSHHLGNDDRPWHDSNAAIGDRGAGKERKWSETKGRCDEFVIGEEYTSGINKDNESNWEPLVQRMLAVDVHRRIKCGVQSSFPNARSTGVQTDQHHQGAFQEHLGLQESEGDTSVVGKDYIAAVMDDVAAMMRVQRCEREANSDDALSPMTPISTLLTVP